MRIAVVVHIDQTKNFHENCCRCQKSISIHTNKFINFLNYLFFKLDYGAMIELTRKPESLDTMMVKKF